MIPSRNLRCNRGGDHPCVSDLRRYTGVRGYLGEHIQTICRGKKNERRSTCDNVFDSRWCVITPRIITIPETPPPHIRNMVFSVSTCH